MMRKMRGSIVNGPLAKWNQRASRGSPGSMYTTSIAVNDSTTRQRATSCSSLSTPISATVSLLSSGVRVETLARGAGEVPHRELAVAVARQQRRAGAPREAGDLRLVPGEGGARRAVGQSV